MILIGQYPDGACTLSNKCGEGQGDCDTDSECKDGLICVRNSCAGQAGENGDGSDCCYKRKYSSVKFLANTISPQKISSYFGTSNKKFTADIWLKTDSSYYLINLLNTTEMQLKKFCLPIPTFTQLNFLRRHFFP